MWYDLLLLTRNVPRFGFWPDTVKVPMLMPSLEEEKDHSSGYVTTLGNLQEIGSTNLYGVVVIGLEGTGDGLDE